MSDAPIPGVIRLHLGVLGTRAVRPFLISDTVTLFMNNTLVSFKTDGGRAPESTLNVTDTLVGNQWVLKTINTSEMVDPPTITKALTDTPVLSPETIYLITSAEAVDTDPLLPSITEMVFIDVNALSNIQINVASETITLTPLVPSLSDSVTMEPLNLYQAVLSDTLDYDSTIVITDTVNTLLT